MNSLNDKQDNIIAFATQQKMILEQKQKALGRAKLAIESCIDLGLGGTLFKDTLKEVEEAINHN